MAGPLSDIIVVDLTRVLAGPYATMVLADLGARVIKVESPAGDDARSFPPFTGGRSAYFESLNRGKESIRLDLTDESDRQRFEVLLADADVLVENFRPGVMDRLGYGFADVHAAYPEMIYASVSGFGQTGPYADRAAYDMVVQAMGGLMSLTGHEEAPPTRVGTSIGDITAGLFTAVGVLTALHDRTRSGTGQHVDVGMLDAQVAILENAIARYAATGDVPGPLGARHPSIAPFGAFATGDGYIVIAAGNDELFADLCGEIDRPDLASDDRFATNELRTVNADELESELERALIGGTTDGWLGRLGTAGIPCGLINDMAAVLADPHVRARNMIVTAELPDGSTVDMAGNPIKLSAHDDPPTRPAAPA